VSTGDSERPELERDRVSDETSRAREAERRLAGEAPDPLHPAPPAEGKWRGILGEVRGMLARRRRERRNRQGA